MPITHRIAKILIAPSTVQKRAVGLLLFIFRIAYLEHAGQKLSAVLALISAIGIPLHSLLSTSSAAATGILGSYAVPLRGHCPNVGADAGQENISLLASHELRQLKCGYVNATTYCGNKRPEYGPVVRRARWERCRYNACLEGGPMRYPKAPRTDLTAPTGKFRVLAVVVEEESADLYTLGDFGSVAAAEQAAIQRAGIGSPVYVYDDKAELLVRYGSWH